MLMALDIMATFHRAVRNLAKAASGHPIPTFMAMLIVGLSKGAHHKYIRRVPTGKFTTTGRPKYRYFYRTVGGKGLGHHDEMHVGAAFAMKDAGKAGHFEVTHDHGDGHVTIKHDETGTEHKIHKDALASMLHNEHAEVRSKDAENARAKAEKAKARAVKELGEAKQSGSAKQIARAKDEAAKHGHRETAEAKSLHVPMKPADQYAHEREKQHEQATTDALKAIAESRVLPEEAKAIARNWVGRMSKGNQRNDSDMSPSSMGQELATIRKVKREDRPPIISEFDRIGTAFRQGAAYDVRRMNHEAYEARSRHRDAVLDHVRKTVGPETGAYVQANQSLLGDIAMGNVKDTAGLAA